MACLVILRKYLQENEDKFDQGCTLANCFGRGFSFLRFEEKMAAILDIIMTSGVSYVIESARKSIL